MNKKKLIAICGKSGSGKDTILKKLSENPIFSPIISYTTRPKRENEIDGIDYHFITKDELIKKIYNNEMLEVADFNDWFYGTAFDSFVDDKINIGIYNPQGLEALYSNKDKIDYLIFFIDAKNKTRLIRSLNRENNPDINEILRRYKTDEENFIDCPFDYWLKNENEEDLN